MSDQLGKYMLVAEVARGGMGIVYLASSMGPGGFSKLLIIKELRPDLAQDPVFLQMFLEEARLAARLNHPNIVQTYEVGADGNRQFIVMEYLDGVALSRVLRKKSPRFTVEMHLRVICEALQGLQYAHTLCEFDGTPLGLVHRDVSPQNVFVTFDGQAKVVDFGIAKARDSSIETNTGVMKGKPAYMPAEQITGDVDARADVYAAGVMIWEAIAGRRLWHRMGDLEILSSVLTGATPDLASIAPHTAPELLAIVKKALTREREDRQASAAALQMDLERYLSTTTNPTMRDVAATVAEIFTEERNTTRTTLEAHINDLKSGRRVRLPSMPESIDHASASFPRPAAVPLDVAILPSLSGPTSSSTLAMSTAIASGTLVSQQDPPLGATPAPAPPPPRKNRVALWAVALALLTVGGFAFGLRARNSAATRTGPRATPPAGDPSSPSGSTAASTAAPVTSDSVSAPEPSPPVPPSASAPLAITTTVKPAAPPPFSFHATPAPKKPTPTVPATTADDRKNSGFLTIDTYPWTSVTIGGKVLGSTPLVRVALPAGTHTLALDNPGENIHKTTTVVIKSGETVSRRLAF